MLNAKHQSIVYTDHKSLIGFLHAEYHEDIFTHWANELRLFILCIQHIPGEKKYGSNGLSRVIINNPDCSPDRLVGKLTKEVFLY